jgi:peptidoglycan hydrolase CwlO-like protein
MIQTVLIFAIIILIAIISAVIVTYILSDKNEPNYYEPKKEIDDNREELKKLDEKIKEIKDEKSNDATHSSNRLNELDI